MIETTCNTKDSVLVAIDIAKHNHIALLEYPTGKRKKINLKNNKADFIRFENLLKESHLPVLIAFEPTADYHRALAYSLQQAKFSCYFVSSIAVSRTREALFNSWDKNDPKDAQVILHLLKSKIVQIYHDPLIHQFNDIQEISNTYHQISKRKTRLYHSLVNHYMALYFPEVENYFHSTRGKWLLLFLITFPTPQSISQYSKEHFIEKGLAIKGYKRFKAQWLSDIYETAKLSIGLPIEEKSQSAKMYKLILSEYLGLTEKRQEIELLAQEVLNKNDDFQRLKTIPGIGPIIGLTILAEVGNLRRFEHPKQFLSFCGFNLCSYSSGTLKGKPHLSKRGNARLRQSLWMAGQIAVTRHENTFRRKYHAYLNKNGETPDNKRKAYTAIAIKMARVVYAVLTKSTDYHGYYECH